MAHCTDAPELAYYTAVRVSFSIVVFGGKTSSWWEENTEWKRTIWTYNLHTYQWAKYIFRRGTKVPARTLHACGVSIGTAVYLFGGCKTMANSWDATNAIWKLSAGRDNCFYWNKILIKEKKKEPSPRIFHSGWKYDNKFWAFGGTGPSPDSYLEEHGEFLYYPFTGYYNNQLLCFDPSCQNWSNPRYFGAAPSPQRCHSTALVNNKLWLYGGLREHDRFLDCLFVLNMDSLTWSEIKTQSPTRYSFFTLTAITDSQLALYNDMRSAKNGISDPWIFDIPSRSWKQYTMTADRARCGHTATTGLNSVIIIGGDRYYDNKINRTYRYNGFVSPVFHIMLWPESLQQLAMKTIHQHKTELPLESLPQKLLCRIMGTEIIEFACSNK